VSAATTWAASQLVVVDPVTPRVIEDVGFRVEGLRGGSTPVGTIVVRIEGQWVEAEVKLPGEGNDTTFKPLRSRVIGLSPGFGQRRGFVAVGVLILGFAFCEFFIRDTRKALKLQALQGTLAPA